MPELTSARPGGDGRLRPGSMTAVMRAMRPATPGGPRWLRWALIRDGRIVREEVRAPDRPLTVGAAGDCDVPLPGASFERRAVVAFDGAWSLAVAPGWRGRLREGGLDGLGELGRDGWRTIALADDARGRIALGGDLALLVQLVDRPPAKTTPHLPASIRGGLMKDADWWFTAFITASFFVHFAVLAVLAEMDWPIDTSVVVPDRVAVTIFPPTPEPIDPPEMAREVDADDAVADADDGDATPDEPSDATPRPRRIADTSVPSPGDAEATDPSLVAEREARRAEQLLIGALMGEGAMQDLLHRGAPTERQADVFAATNGTTVASNDAGRMDERQGGCGEECMRRRRGIGTLDRRGGTGPIGEGVPIEERVIPRVTTPGFDDPPPPEGPGGFDPRELHNALRGRMTAIRRCYEHEITQSDPNLAGRITLVMTVVPVGTVSNVHGEDNTTGSSSLEACAVRAVQTVRVRTGPEMAVTVRYPVVFARAE